MGALGSSFLLVHSITIKQPAGLEILISTPVNIIKEGFKLSFVFTPLSAEFRKNRSAIKNLDFVTEAIKKLLKTGLVREPLQKPIVIIPLSFDENKGKERLILDLRYVNKHLMKGTVKYTSGNVFKIFFWETLHGYIILI